MDNIQFSGLCGGVPCFIKYMQNWYDTGMISLDIIFYEASPDLQKNALME